jgi:hypothetical protein
MARRIPPQKLSYYQKRKDDPAFREKRRLWAQRYREAHPELRAYYRTYAKKYYKANREAINAYQRSRPDATRNERVNRFKKRERAALGKAYILQLICRNGKLKKQDVTPYMIKKRRTQILHKRAAKAAAAAA